MASAATLSMQLLRCSVTVVVVPLILVLPHLRVVVY